MRRIPIAITVSPCVTSVRAADKGASARLASPAMTAGMVHADRLERSSTGPRRTVVPFETARDPPTIDWYRHVVLPVHAVLRNGPGDPSPHLGLRTDVAIRQDREGASERQLVAFTLHGEQYAAPIDGERDRPLHPSYGDRRRQWLIRG